MTIKFDKSAANEWLKAVDGASLTLPDAEWSVGFVIVTDGLYTGADNQVLFSTGGLAAGSLNISYLGPGHANANTLGVQVGSSSTLRNAPNGSLASSTRWLCVLHRSSTGVLTFKLCPTLSAAPANGSVVASYALASVTMSGVYDGPGGLTIGGRSDNAANRLFDQAIARVFRIDGSLTDLEIARLAYGESILDLGKSPVFYFRMDDPADIADRGSAGIDLNPSGTLSTGGDPQFGYASGQGPTAPSFASGPVISGTPVVGTAVSFTSGTASGYPAPVLSQQWTLDGADIPGATGATYMPVAGDAGKALRVRQIADNDVEPNATSTSAPVSVAAAGANTVAEIANHTLFPRSGSTAQVALSGTYTGAASSVEVQLYAVDGVTVLQAWTALTGVVLSGGNWSGTLTANTGGMYRHAARFKDAGGTATGSTAISTNQWGVALMIACAGSSSAYSYFRSGTYPDVAGSTIRRYTAGAWGTFPSASNGIAKQIAADLSARLGVPVGMIDTGVSGSTLKEWTTNSAGTWGRFDTIMTAAGGKLDGLIVSMGSNDVADKIVVSRAAHAAMMRDFIAKVRARVANPNLPIVWSGFNRRIFRDGSGVDITSQYDAQANYVRMAEIDVSGDSNVYHFPTFDFAISSDETHLASYAGTGVRMVYMFNEIMAGGQARRCPRITELKYSGDTLTAIVSYGNGTASSLTPGADWSGFTLTDASGTPAVVSRSLVGGKPTIKYDRTLVAPVVARYMSGANPDVSAPLFDNGATALPLLVEADLASANVTPQPVPGATIDAAMVPTSRVVVFGGGSRVVTFDVPWVGLSKGEKMTNAPEPYFKDGKWWVDKDPDEQSYYVANITKELADRGTTAASVAPVVKGVEVLIAPEIQGNFVVIKLGGLDVTQNAENFWTARVTCANGERFDRTMWFNRVDN